MRLAILLGSTALGAACISFAPQSISAEAAAQAPAAERDGSHDFDFNFGYWHTHIKRHVHPLAGSDEFIELDGTVGIRKVWGGRALLEEIEADGPKGHWEGLSLFLYNPTAHQWSQTFVNSQTGVFGGGLVGAFKDGRGELFQADTLDGRSILVRGVWSNIAPTSHRYEESYSQDGGKTWEVQFAGDKTKVDAAQMPVIENTDGSHEYDFDFGTWQTHTSRLLHPLSGRQEWADSDGTTVVTPLWGGRANLAEYKAIGPSGTIELMALRIYNPKTHEWSINFATPARGELSSTPGVGRFKNGRVDYYDQEKYEGKTILVRFSMWGITPDTAQSEQAFSLDGGQTWEVNWINKYTRSKTPTQASSHARSG
ncbi:MAG TPA: hypothetical protein VFB32_10385 [Rudaea sp.]|nr:hypothetical protein [Rudaea sp.]